MAQAETERICDEMSQKIIETAEALVMTQGTHMLTVRSILKELNILLIKMKLCQIGEIVVCVMHLELNLKS